MRVHTLSYRIREESGSGRPPTRVHLLGGGGKLPPNVSASFPPKKVSLEKNLKLFQINISFDDDFKESVKVTNVQKCDFSQS